MTAQTWFYGAGTQVTGSTFQARNDFRSGATPAIGLGAAAYLRHTSYPLRLRAGLDATFGFRADQDKIENARLQFSQVWYISPSCGLEIPIHHVKQEQFTYVYLGYKKPFKMLEANYYDVQPNSGFRQQFVYSPVLYELGISRELNRKKHSIRYSLIAAVEQIQYTNAPKQFGLYAINASVGWVLNRQAKMTFTRGCHRTMQTTDAFPAPNKHSKKK
ncbi:MAG: hypothetical protein JNL57_12435 [Bacteroidetes bacterium]|nr:hypothetical protein [Bacteroidota bacterium]